MCMLLTKHILVLITGAYCEKGLHNLPSAKKFWWSALFCSSGNTIEMENNRLLVLGLGG
jgi:hypothetical protein